MIQKFNAKVTANFSPLQSTSTETCRFQTKICSRNGSSTKPLCSPLCGKSYDRPEPCSAECKIECRRSLPTDLFFLESISTEIVKVRRELIREMFYLRSPVAVRCVASPTTAQSSALRSAKANAGGEALLTRPQSNAETVIIYKLRIKEIYYTEPSLLVILK